MNLKYIHKRPPPDGQGTEETLATRDTTGGYPVPSVDDRVRIGDEFYHVWDVFHALDCEHVDAFDDRDEVHVFVVGSREAGQLAMARQDRLQDKLIQPE